MTVISAAKAKALPLAVVIRFVPIAVQARTLQIVRVITRVQPAIPTRHLIVDLACALCASLVSMLLLYTSTIVLHALLARSLLQVEQPSVLHVRRENTLPPRV